VSKDLTPEKAFIFRIVHRDNVPWILDHGLHCKNSNMLDPNYVEIGNPDLISRRDNHPVVPSPSGTLSDYIPFYFTPFSPMMYNIKTGWGGIRRRDNDEIVIMVSSLRMLHNRNIPFLFTDRHAYLVAAQFYSDLARLDQIDWNMIQRRDFRNDPDDPSKKERYQAEALVHKHLPVDALSGMACYNDEVLKTLTAALAKRKQTMKVVEKPDWYFR
jgi:ssDNA thymidine ADP-ribosyltransferase, DarT